MYNEQLEQLIDAALTDGVLTEKEKQILFKKAQAMGVDLDEFEMVLDARLVKLKKDAEEKAKSSAPKSNKYGDVKKCPACGAIVQSYQGICSECGYAFEGVDANIAIKELSTLLQKNNDLTNMKNIIDSFPIPMEKSTLLAFITWLRPQSIDISNPLSSSYLKKYSECVDKIKVSFANDKQLSPFISYLQDDLIIIKKKKVSIRTIKNKWFWIAVSIVFIILCNIIVSIIENHSDAKEEKARIECVQSIRTALKNGENQKAKDLFLNSHDNYSFNLNKEDCHVEIIKALLEEDNLSDAMKVGMASGMVYKSSYDSHALPADLLYNYCINHGDFENAKRVCGTADKADYYNGMYIKDVVTYLCEQGNKDEAKKFLTIHEGEIDKEHDKLGSSDEVVKQIQTIIDQY